MKSLKMLVYLFLALTMSLSLLTGCVRLPNELAPSPEQTGSTETSETPASPVQTESKDYSDMPYSNGLDERGFWTGIRALDYVETLNYIGISIPNNIHQISDETLQTEIQGIMANFTTPTKITDRAIVDGDTVNVDYDGSIDGVAFEGGSTNGMGADVTIGVTDYIDDFLEQLIGHSSGETINIEVTFPDDYGQDNLNGKDAVFVTTINYIVGEVVQAELTDDFVAENLTSSYGWTTVQEMKDDMISELKRQSVEQFVVEYLTSQVAIKSVPDQLMKYQENVMLYYYQDYADYYGVDLSELLSNEGLSSVDELIENYYDMNKNNATYYLVTQAVAEDAGISVSTAEVGEYFAESNGSSDYSAQEEQFGLPYIMHHVLCRKVLNYIIDNAVML